MQRFSEIGKLRKIIAGIDRYLKGTETLIEASTERSAGCVADHRNIHCDKIAFKCGTGTARLGIEATEWKVKGLSGAEIAKMYGVKPNLVGAWISRAAGRLKQNRDFMQYFDRSVEIDSS